MDNQAERTDEHWDEFTETSAGKKLGGSPAGFEKHKPLDFQGSSGRLDQVQRSEVLLESPAFDSVPVTRLGHRRTGTQSGKSGSFCGVRCL